MECDLQLTVAVLSASQAVISLSITKKFKDFFKQESLPQEGDKLVYRTVVNITVYEEEYDLILNAEKKKELTLGFRKIPTPAQPPSSEGLRWREG